MTNRLDLQEGVADVWVADLDAAATDDRDLVSLLSADESDRAESFRFEKDRLHFATARGILRFLSAGYLGADPKDIEFEFTERGKPTIASAPDLGFNLSHSSGLGVFAFVNGHAVGVDVESIERELEFEDISRKFFSEAEADALLKVPPEQLPRAFFNCWTRKEAFIKAVGVGLSFPLNEFEVSFAPGEEAKLLATHWDPEEAKQWSLHSFEPAPGFTAALAVRAEIEEVRVRDWRESRSG